MCEDTEANKSKRCGTLSSNMTDPTAKAGLEDYFKLIKPSYFASPLWVQLKILKIKRQKSCNPAKLTSKPGLQGPNYILATIDGTKKQYTTDGFHGHKGLVTYTDNLFLDKTDKELCCKLWSHNRVRTISLSMFFLLLQEEISS